MLINVLVLCCLYWFFCYWFTMILNFFLMFKTLFFEEKLQLNYRPLNIIFYFLHKLQSAMYL